MPIALDASSKNPRSQTAVTVATTVPGDSVVLALGVELMAVILPAALSFGAGIRSAVEKSTSSRQVAKTVWR